MVDAMNHAGFAVRLQAFLWDYLLMLLYILLLVVLSLRFPPVQLLFQEPVQSDVAAFVVLVLPVMLYFVLSESGKCGATWGKWKKGLRVVRADGRRLDLGRSLLRSLLKFLPWQVAHTAIFHTVQEGMLPQRVLWLLYAAAYGLVVVYALMLWLSSTHRTLYDWIADSAVIKL